MIVSKVAFNDAMVNGVFASFSRFVLRVLISCSLIGVASITTVGADAIGAGASLNAARIISHRSASAVVELSVIGERSVMSFSYLSLVRERGAPKLITKVLHVCCRYDFGYFTSL